MKQSSNSKAISPQPIPAKIEKSITHPLPAFAANPEIDVKKSSSQAHFYNPAVHLKKNFLKFTKAATSTTYEGSKDIEISRQQQVLRRQLGGQNLEDNIKQSSKFLKEQNRVLQEKTDFLENQCQKRQRNIIQKDMQLSELAKGMDEWQRKIISYQQNEAKLTALLNYYQSLSSNCQLCRQTSEKYTKMRLLYEQICEKCNQLEKILQTKDLLMQNHMNAKNDELKSALASKNNQIKSLDLRICILQKENLRSYEQLAKANTTKADQRASKFQKIGQEFQLKIEQAINQNIKLRNSINNLQGTIEQLKQKNASLQNVLKAYQDSEQLNSGSKARCELDLLRSQLQKCKQEYDHMASKYEYEILRLQNRIFEERLDKGENLLDFSDSERLREALMNAIWQIQALKANHKERK